MRSHKSPKNWIINGGFLGSVALCVRACVRLCQVAQRLRIHWKKVSLEKKVFTVRGSASASGLFFFLALSLSPLSQPFSKSKPDGEKIISSFLSGFLSKWKNWLSPFSFPAKFFFVATFSLLPQLASTSPKCFLFLYKENSCYILVSVSVFQRFIGR